MLEIINQIFTDHTLRTVALGSAVIGIAAGTLGSFAFLRRQSLVGDVVAHSSLAGITIAFLIAYLFNPSGEKSSLILIIGAGAAGLASMSLVSGIIKKTKIKSDAALGLMLAVFFGTGVFILKLIQQNALPGQAGLESYIFGMAAAMTTEDVWIISIFGFISVSTTVLFWKEFKMFSFDPAYAEIMGFSSKKLETMLTAAIVIAIVTGLQSVGVILMVALIVAPPSAARQWTNKLELMTLLSAAFGAVSGTSGAVLSAIVPNLPTGPAIVLFATGIFVLSLFFAPKRGIIPAMLKNMLNKRNVFLDSVLLDLFILETNHDAKDYTGHKSAVLKTMTSGKIGVRKTLNVLEKLGMVEQTDAGKDLWKLTEAGSGRAKQIINKKILRSA